MAETKGCIESEGKKKTDPILFEQAFLNFLQFIKNQRKEHYTKFVNL